MILIVVKFVYGNAPHIVPLGLRIALWLGARAQAWHVKLNIIINK